MPTAYGVAFGFVCFLLFGIGFASTNNAVYFLCFFLVALGSQSLVLTNRNIEKLRITRVDTEDFFMDEAGTLRVLVHNSGSEEIEEVTLELKNSSPVFIEKIKAGEHREIRVPFQVSSPGSHRVPALKISSDFPYHFSRSWKKYFHENPVCVFPPRRGSSQFAPAALVNQALDAQALDDFKGHREYQKTDSPRSIDWRVSARIQKIMVKEFDPHSSRKISLRWEDCPQTADADKKSQLSLWIDLAEKNHLEYALEIPGRQLGFGSGPQHKNDCLRALL